MSRPAKATVEYFPHYCRHGRVIFVLESKWGNDGYSAFYKLYEVLGDTEGHAYDCRKDGAWDYLVALLRIDDTTAHEIIAKLCILGVFDKNLWHNHLVLWSDCFVDDLKEVYLRRKIQIPVKPNFCIHESESHGLLSELSIQKPPPEGLLSTLCQQKPTDEMRVDESRVEKKKTLVRDDENPSPGPPAPHPENPPTKRNGKITYDFDAHTWQHVTSEQLALWGKLCPALDIPACLNDMALWLEGHPKNRKSDYKKFITGWLKREQDRARPVGGGPCPPANSADLAKGAFACFSRCHGTCAATWETHQDKPQGQCYWCKKFDHKRAAVPARA